MTPREQAELRELIDAYLAEEASETQLVALERLLAASEEARLFYLGCVEVHAGLAWEHREPAAAGPPLPSPARLPFRPRFFRPAVLLPVAAAIALLASVFVFTRPAATTIAVVKASLHGQWASGEEVDVGERLGSGRWELQSGLVELETGSGTTLLVEAPASLDLTDALHARLVSGNLVVRMPKGKSGFIVEMPQLKVTDLGTEFGVSVAPNGESRVQVYEGKVLAEAGKKGTAGREVTAGNSLGSRSGEDLAPVGFSETRFIRRFPPPRAGEIKGGPLFNESSLAQVKVAPAPAGVIVDADLSDWNRDGAFHSACLPPYDSSYFIDGMMMYDASHLYIGARVGDPEPMCNSARDGVEFAGGSVIVRLSTNRASAWPLSGSSKHAPRLKSASPANPDERVITLVLWYDARSAKARLTPMDGFGFQRRPAGEDWQGAFRKNADGLGYTLEYSVPWSFLRDAGNGMKDVGGTPTLLEGTPRAGDELAALWMVHWSDREGQICRGQLVDVTNHGFRPDQKIPPANFFQYGASWGKAVFLPER